MIPPNTLVFSHHETRAALDWKQSCPSRYLALWFDTCLRYFLFAEVQHVLVLLRKDHRFPARKKIDLIPFIFGIIER